MKSRKPPINRRGEPMRRMSGEPDNPDVPDNKVGTESTVSPDAAKVEVESHVEEDPYRARQLQALEDRLRITQGFLPPDHPASIAATQMMRASRTLDKPVPPVQVLALDPNINAMAVAGGSTYVNMGLLTRATTREGIIGVLGHESAHVEHEDTEPHSPPNRKKRREQDPHAYVQSRLKIVSVDRLMEYRADLEGAVYELDRAGVNPMGYKQFLEEIDRMRKRAKGRVGVTHGSSLDRALTISALSRYFDMVSLKQPLTPIDPSTKQAWKSGLMDPSLATAYLFRPIGRTDANGAKQRLRTEVWPTLSTQERQRCFGLMLQKWSVGSSARERPLIMEALRAGYVATNRDIEAVCQKGDDPAQVRYLHYTLNLGFNAAPYVWKRSFWGGDSNDVVAPLAKKIIATGFNEVDSAEALDSMRQVLPRLREFGLPYAAGQPEALMRTLTRHSMENKLFGECHVQRFDIEGCYTILESWANDVAEYMDEFGTNPVSRSQLMRRCLAEIENYYQQQTEDFHGDAPFAKWIDEQFVTRINQSDSSQSATRRGELFMLTRRIESDRAFQGVLLRLFGHSEQAADITTVRTELHTVLDRYVAEVTPDMYGEVYTAFFETATEYHSAQGSVRDREMVHLDDPLSVNSNKYVEAIGLFGVELHDHLCRTIEQEPQFSELSSVQMRVMLQAVSGYLPNRERHDATLHTVHRRSSENEAGISQDETALLQSLVEADVDMLVWLQNFSVIRSLGLQVGVETTAKKYFKEERHFMSVLLPRVLAAQCSKGSAAKRWKLFSTWEGAGIDVQKAFKRDAGSAAIAASTLLSDLAWHQGKGTEAALLTTVAAITPNKYLAHKLRGVLLDRDWEAAPSFAEKTAIAFDSERAKGNIAIKERVMEDEMRTKAHYQEVTGVVDKRVEQLFDEGDLSIGVYALSDLWAPPPEKALEAITALLETADSDKALRILITERQKLLSWDVEGGDNIMDGENNVNADKAKRLVLRRLASIDMAIGALYGTTEVERHILVKKLMIDTGIVQDPKHRKVFLDTVMEKSIRSQDGEEDVQHIIDQAKNALATADQWELLYFGLSPFMVQRIGLAPEQPTAWEDIPEALDTWAVAQDYGKTGVTEQQFFAPVKPRRGEFKQEPWRFADDTARQFNGHLTAWLTEQGALEHQQAEPLSPLEFVVEAAPRLGALPVRFLQILPQFVNIPERYADSFSKLYDRMKGQTKFASIQTVEREWPAGEDMWDTIIEFGDRIGGGSLMTVYEIRTAEGPRVIRVRNPNIEFHLEATRDFLLTIIDRMHGAGAFDTGTHTQLRQGIDHISEWIKQELDFERFGELDAQFAAGLQEDADNNLQYALFSPNSEGPRSNYFQIEDKVDGVNLTQWEELEASHDMKQVVAAIAKSLAAQAERGVMHGDVHIGNYAVTEDNRIAVYDRTFFIELNEQERSLAAGALRGEVNVPDILSYFSGLPGADTATVAEQLPALLLRTGAELQSGSFTAVNQALVEMRGMGIEVPLHLTLLLRNVHAIDKLAKKAGLSSVQAALHYEA